MGLYLKEAPFLMEGMKRCGTCKTEKPRTEFGKRSASVDGLAAKCKSCQSAYDKARANNPDRVAMREAYAQTEQGQAARRRARDKYAENNRAEQRERAARYKEENPVKRRAHELVAHAVRIGSLVRQPCEVCGEKSDVAHHDDYAKPLDVRWLCASDHRKWHAENGPGLNG